MPLKTYRRIGQLGGYMFILGVIALSAFVVGSKYLAHGQWALGAVCVVMYLVCAWWFFRVSDTRDILRMSVDPHFRRRMQENAQVMWGDWMN